MATKDPYQYSGFYTRQAEEIHQRIMAMTTEEIGQATVDAGIYTPDGQLTAHYRPARDKKRRRRRRGQA